MKSVIGWVESIDFPSWGILGVKAKVDTGARTSALHVENLVQLGEGQVQFEVVYKRKTLSKRKLVKASVLRWSHVRSSTGEKGERCFVRTTMRMGAVEKEIEISLVPRSKMRFRMLLGRQAIGHDFLVDVGRRYLYSPPSTRRQR